MTSQLSISNNKMSRETLTFSNTPARGRFESRPFVVQSKNDNSKQPDLKTSLIQAEKYGHHLNKINLANQPDIRAVIPKEHNQTVQLARVKKTPSKPNRKPVDYYTSNNLRFARKHRINKLKKRSGVNLATAKLRITRPDQEKIRYLTKSSAEAKHSEEHIISRVNKIKELEADKGGSVRLEKISSELEDCGKDNQNCNKKVGKHPDQPNYRFGLAYRDRRDHAMGREDVQLSVEERKKQRANAVKKLRKADTKLRKDSKKYKIETKTDSDYSDLEYDSLAGDSGTDTEYETDVDTPNWNDIGPKNRKRD